MLQTPTEFPHAGSYALYRGDKVRIQQINANGTRLISGRSRKHGSIMKTVAVDQLAPFAEAQHNVQRWADERIATVTFDPRTRAGAAWEDYAAWYEREQPADPIVTRQAFARRVFAMGYRTAPLSGGARAWNFTLNAEPRKAGHYAIEPQRDGEYCDEAAADNWAVYDVREGLGAGPAHIGDFPTRAAAEAWIAAQICEPA